MPQNLTPRPHYMDWLNRWKDKDLIKVVTGLRRCGKSSTLKLFREHLIASGIESSRILALNFESLKEEYPREAHALYAFVVERLAPNTINYVFLDEVQHVENFERAVDALFVRDDVDLYITGSNAYFLSGELATLLTGRYVELRMLPFSFAEYIQARSSLAIANSTSISQTDSSPRQVSSSPTQASSFPSQISTDGLFNDYLLYGGMPFITQLHDEQSISDYLAGVFNTIVLQDIAHRHPKMDMRSFMATASFAADNIGNITSRQKIANTLSTAGTKTAPSTVSDYLDALIENFLVFKAGRYDIKGKEHLKTLEKYYLGDLGFRFWLLGIGQGDIGHRLENAVYLELLRRYRHVFVGRVGRLEADFVVESDQGPKYFQVAQSILDDNVRQREFASLEAIKDNYPKTVLTLDKVGTGDYKGIEHANIIEWMLQGS